MTDVSRASELAASYLDHLQIIVSVRDTGANLRDFLDPWWAYSRGGPFLKRTRTNGLSPYTMNFPCAWEHRERLPRLDWVSADARAVLDMGERARVRDKKNHPPEFRLVVDHSVPFAVIRAHLFDERATWTPETLRSYLDHHFKRALLTHRQHQELSNMGLSSAMPHGWTKGGDPYARYEESRGTRQR